MHPDDPFAIWKIPRIIDSVRVWESQGPTVSVPKAPLLGSQPFCPPNSFGSLPANSHLTRAALVPLTLHTCTTQPERQCSLTSVFAFQFHRLTFIYSRDRPYMSYWNRVNKGRSEQLCADLLPLTFLSALSSESNHTVDLGSPRSCRVAQD